MLTLKSLHKWPVKNGLDRIANTCYQKTSKKQVPITLPIILSPQLVGADKMKDQPLGRNESGGVEFGMKRDPRITRVGRIIRGLSLDELPQFWDVLRGDMSLVGPRPPVPKEAAQYEYSDRMRLDAIPGITCMRRVSGRSEIEFKGRVRLDVRYSEKEPFAVDIKALLKTIPTMLFGRGAY